MKKSNKANKAKRMTKKEIYASFGILFDGNKLFHPVYGWINPLLIDGNAKIGKSCYHFSTLPTRKEFTVIVNEISYTLSGTCKCNCVGCYAEKGNYRYQSTKNALGMRTLVIRNDIQWFINAVMAQIIADKIKLVRIHAAGDFDSLEYVKAWQYIVENNPNVVFWTYTKVKEYENAFDNYSNANIVKSIIPEIGLNFGHCDYIESAYHALKKAGKKVHICHCGVDDNKHCTNCKGCSQNEYVLFLEHSTDYQAKKDALYAKFAEMVLAQ